MMHSPAFRTTFGSLRQYTRGEIELIDDDRRHYTFSNIFDVAARSRPYEKVVVGKNLEYVIEVLRAEGRSEWFAAAHDEFALVMDGQVAIELVRLEDFDDVVDTAIDGSQRLVGTPAGPRMGRMRLRRGHQALLPCGAAYRFAAAGAPGVVILQTIRGRHSVEKWSQICLT